MRVQVRGTRGDRVRTRKAPSWQQQKAPLATSRQLAPSPPNPALSHPRDEAVKTLHFTVTPKAPPNRSPVRRCPGRLHLCAGSVEQSRADVALGWPQPGRVCRNVFVQRERPAAVGPWRGGASGDTEGDRGGLGDTPPAEGTPAGWGCTRCWGVCTGARGEGARACTGTLMGTLVCTVHTLTHVHPPTRTPGPGSLRCPWVQGMCTLTPNSVLPSLSAPFGGTHSPKATHACSRVGRRGPWHPSHPALFHRPTA